MSVMRIVAMLLMRVVAIQLFLVVFPTSSAL